jgi:hypothetical protein
MKLFIIQKTELCSINIFNSQRMSEFHYNLYYTNEVFKAQHELRILPQVEWLTSR